MTTAELRVTHACKYRDAEGRCPMCGETTTTAATKVEPEPTTVTYYRASCTCGWSLLYATPDSASGACRTHATYSCPMVDRSPQSA